MRMPVRITGHASGSSTVANARSAHADASSRLDDAFINLGQANDGVAQDWERGEERHHDDRGDDAEAEGCDQQTDQSK